MNQSVVSPAGAKRIAASRPTGGPQVPKNRLEKQVLAWWLRQRTTVSRRLGMGEESGVTRAVRAYYYGQPNSPKRIRLHLVRDELLAGA